MNWRSIPNPEIQQARLLKSESTYRWSLFNIQRNWTKVNVIAQKTCQTTRPDKRLKEFKIEALHSFITRRQKRNIVHNTIFFTIKPLSAISTPPPPPLLPALLKKESPNHHVIPEVGLAPLRYWYSRAPLLGQHKRSKCNTWLDKSQHLINGVWINFIWKDAIRTDHGVKRTRRTKRWLRF